MEAASVASECMRTLAGIRLTTDDKVCEDLRPLTGTLRTETSCILSEATAAAVMGKCIGPIATIMRHAEKEIVLRFDVRHRFFNSINILMKQVPTQLIYYL